MDEWEYRYIRREIFQLMHVDLNAYKSAQVQRRLETYLLRSGFTTWRSLFLAIHSSPAAITELRNYLTINVSAFFRDPEPYAYLREQIIAELIGQRASVRIWSAGCAHGQEAYSLAMLFDSAGAQRYQILATDLDSAALAVAQAGGPYPSADLASVPADLRHYLEARPLGYWVGDSLRRHVIFRQHDLLQGAIAGTFDLIVCRNVMIYFTGAAKDLLYRRFYHALRPGGVLFVGGTEVVAKSADSLFEPIGVSFYRKR